MPSITQPTPVYDAMMALATPEEEKAIRDAGDPKWLSSRLQYGDSTGVRPSRALQAYKAFDQILERVIADPLLRVTAVDTRCVSLLRTDVDAALVRSGDLWWSHDGLVSGELRFDWGGDELVRLIGVHIEPAAAPSPPTLAVSSRERPNDRIDDTEHLREMREQFDKGMPYTTAARAVATKTTNRHDEDNWVRRLSRKWLDEARKHRRAQ